MPNPALIPLKLPPTLFTHAPSSSTPRALGVAARPNDSSAHERACARKIRVKLTPHLLIPSPPFTSALGHNSRKIEDVVDVIVEVGGKVELAVNVEGEEGVVGMEEGELCEVIERVFTLNASRLALRSVTSSPTCLILHPLIADPAQSSALQTLTVTGRPAARLVKLDIGLQWSPGPAIGPAEEGSDDEGQVLDGYTAKAIMDGRAHEDDDELLEFGELDIEDADTTTGTASTASVPDSGGPRRHVEEALHKLIRTHMIKRYPLIFDAGLIARASTFAPHPSFTSSMTRFLSLALTHNRAFLPLAQDSLLALGAAQEAHVAAYVDAAARLSSRRGKMRSRGKMRGKGKGRARSSGNAKGAKRRKMSAEGERGEAVCSGSVSGSDVEPLEQSEDGDDYNDDAKKRANEYMRALYDRLEMEEAEAGAGKDLVAMRRLLRESMGAVGRARWEVARRGKGRMAAWRVPLVTLDSAHNAVNGDGESEGGGGNKASLRADESDAGRRAQAGETDAGLDIDFDNEFLDDMGMAGAGGQDDEDEDEAGDQAGDGDAGAEEGEDMLEDWDGASLLAWSDDGYEPGEESFGSGSSPAGYSHAAATATSAFIAPLGFPDKDEDEDEDAGEDAEQGSARSVGGSDGGSMSPGKWLRGVRDTEQPAPLESLFLVDPDELFADMDMDMDVGMDAEINTLPLGS